jgi:hypothetical protein
MRKVVPLTALFSVIAAAAYLHNVVFFQNGHYVNNKYVFQMHLLFGLPRDVSSQAIGVAVIGGVVGFFTGLWLNARDQRRKRREQALAVASRPPS